MANVTYTIREKQQVDEDRERALDPVGTVFRQVMLREFNNDLVVCNDLDEYALDVYDIGGSAVVVSGEEVNIISRGEDSVAAIKNTLKERLRYFTLEERD